MMRIRRLQIKKNKISIAIVIGTALEHYDLLLYAHFLHVISALFFPHSDPRVSSILIFLSYGATYLFKPVGGVILAHFGDKRGRQSVLSFSILLMAFPSFIIGCLPTYASIGILAPIILIFCRLAQSFSEGGETPAAAILLVENAKEGSASFYSSLVNVATLLGGILGALMGLIFTLEGMPEWGWRIPFILGGFLGLVGAYIRRKGSETPLFKKAQKEDKIQQIPFLHALKHYKKSMICNLGICTGVVSAFNFTIAYIPYVSKNAFSLKVYETFLLSTFFMSLTIVFLLIWGKIADKIDKKIVMAGGAIFSSILIPMVILSTEKGDFKILLILQSFTCLAMAALTAPLNALASYSFPTEIRFSGNAFIWGIGGAMFGGVTPLICHLLKEWTGSFIGPSLYIMACQLLALISIYSIPTLDKVKSLSKSGSKVDELKVVTN